MFRFFRFLPSAWWSPKAWKSWGTYVHWRLETYGVFYPQGRFNRYSFLHLLRQFPSYSRWLANFDKLRKQADK